ncbi:MAG TPA: hypothetical protein VGJ16_05590 [Pirellulales bacterium]
MTGVSLFSPDDPAAVSADPIARPETPPKRAGGAEPPVKSARVASTGEPRHRAEPQLVLSLPDLDAIDGAEAIVRLPLASHAYWVFIALGALLAGWLILSGKKQPDRPMDEAPAWSNSPAAAQPAGPPSSIPAPAPSEPAASAPGSSIRTARTADVPWMSRSNPARPSEAAPLGISPGVSQ